MDRLLLWAMLIIPWLSLFFINKHSLKRFMPVAILASLLVTMVFEMGYVFNWWVILKKLVPWGEITSVPLTYGIFLVGTIWIFHFTYDKAVWKYFLANAVIDGLYSFPILKGLISMGIYELKNMGHFGIFVLMTIIAVMIYSYQKWQDKIMKLE